MRRATSAPLADVVWPRESGETVVRSTNPLRVVALLMAYNAVSLLIAPTPLVPLWQGQPPIDAIIVGVLGLIAMVGILRCDPRWGRKLGIGLVVVMTVLWAISVVRFLTTMDAAWSGIWTVVGIWAVGLAITGFMLFELVWRWPTRGPQDQ